MLKSLITNQNNEELMIKLNLDEEDDKKTSVSSELVSAKLEPLPSLDKLCLDYNSIEMNWKSSRKNCNCSKDATSFDCASAKLNCSRCGEIFCERCVENGKYMTSQVSTRLIFVCNFCIDRFQL